MVIIAYQFFFFYALRAQSNELILPPSLELGEITLRSRVQSEQIVSQLNRLQQQIKDHARPVSLEAAVAIGLRENPELLQAFSTIQQFEWQLISAQRQWYPTLQFSNGTPFAGASWNTFVNDNYAISSERLHDQGLQRKEATKSQLNLVQPGMIANWNLIDPVRQPNIKEPHRKWKVI